MVPDTTPAASSGLSKLAELYQRYAPTIFASLTQRMHSEEDAEDILVEIFLAALEDKQFASLPEKTQLAWLWRVARNKTTDTYRRSYRQKERSIVLDSIIDSVTDDERNEPENSTLRQEEYDTLKSHIEQLSSLQQKVLEMRFHRNLLCSEIAAKMGKNEGAIRVMLSRTLNMLKNIYHTEREDERNANR